MAFPPTNDLVKLLLSFDSELSLSCTSDIDLIMDEISVRVGPQSTKSDLILYFELALFGQRPKYEFELFKHGREAQWRWRVEIAGPGMEYWRAFVEGESIGANAGETGRGPVGVKGCIAVNPNFMPGSASAEEEDEE